MVWENKVLCVLTNASSGSIDLRVKGFFVDMPNNSSNVGCAIRLIAFSAFHPVVAAFGALLAAEVRSFIASGSKQVVRSQKNPAKLYVGAHGRVLRPRCPADLRCLSSARPFQVESFLDQGSSNLQRRRGLSDFHHGLETGSLRQGLGKRKWLAFTIVGNVSL